MITLFVEENNPHTTTSYNSFITDLQFHQLKCTCGHACGLSVHGCYQRFIKTAEGKLCFRICWVACEACGKTHALMRYSIAPLITGLSDDYTSLEAFYRDAPAKGVVHPDGSLKHYAPGTIEKWYRNYKQEGFDAFIASITDKNITADLAICTLKKALESQKSISPDLILHSDQGSQYTSKDFIEFCSSSRIRQSMSKAGYPYDNAPMERYYNTLKNELIYLHYYHNDKELNASVEEFAYVTNHIRPHSYN